MSATTTPTTLSAATNCKQSRTHHKFLSFTPCTVAWITKSSSNLLGIGYSLIEARWIAFTVVGEDAVSAELLL